MSFEPGHPSPMGASEGKTVAMEERLRGISAAFPYPETPDFAARDWQRLMRQKPSSPRLPRVRLTFAVVALALLLMATLLITPVRARVLDWIGIGSVRIFFNQPTPAATASPEATPTFLRSVLDLAGETSFSEAQAGVSFTIQLPAYPPDLGMPEHVYLQQYNRPGVILAWMEPEQPDQVRMSLTEAPSGTYIFEKFVPDSVVDTQVNGSPAVWVEGDYPLLTRAGDITMTRLVNQSHTLIWTEGELTFRLETDVDLETAIRIAESIR